MPVYERYLNHFYMCKRILLLFVCCFMFLNFSVFSQGDALRKFLSTPGLQHASVGISVIDLKTGAKRETLNENMALTPASTLKTITTATALSLFPPTHCFQTRVYYTGDVSPEGVLRGDLWIVGEGDPSLESIYSGMTRGAFGQRIVAALKGKGVRKISGSVKALSTSQDALGVSPYWTWEDMGNYYAAGAYSLNFGDNLYKLVLDTSRKGERPRVKRTDPEMPGLRFDNQLLSKSLSFDSAYIHGAPFSDHRVIVGAVPHRGEEFQIKGDVPNPPLFAAQQITRILLKGGIGVAGEAETGDVSEVPSHLLLTYKGAPLSHLVSVTNKRSNNLYAEALLQLIGTKSGVANPSSGIAMIRSYWQSRGLSPEALFMYDGSGLAPTDKVTPAFMAGMLRQMHSVPEFVASLPVAGQEGTVANFLKGSSLAGKARLKSGSIQNVIAYVGYIEGEEPCAVVVMVNNYYGPSARIRNAIGVYLQSLR